MRKTVVTLLAVLVAGCRASERSETAGPSREPPSSEKGLRIYDDDSAFLELQKDLKAAESDFEEEWKTIHIDRDWRTCKP